ncbi:MAG: hypothetical protein NTZ02_00475 [Candidatus Woesearchaeota archaeon]|nr:hypothetical protein [Candidatus Woesearchaeota archaeon]
MIGISNVMIETVENMGYNFIGCSVMPSVCGKYAGKVNAIFTRKRDYKIPKNPRSKD